MTTGGCDTTGSLRRPGLQPSDFDPGLHPEAHWPPNSEKQTEAQAWYVPEPTEQIERLAPHISAFLQEFNRKSLDYGDDGAGNLGVKGQYADINRKVLKLKRALWDGIELVGEPVDEVIRDLIGHLFLTLDMLAPSMSGESWSRKGGLTGFAYGVLWDGPHSDCKEPARHWHDGIYIHPESTTPDGGFRRRVRDEPQA